MSLDFRDFVFEVLSLDNGNTFAWKKGNTSLADEIFGTLFTYLPGAVLLVK